jgi:Ethanolamine utilization protein EutJ (predicted chaperonin)
VRRHLDTLEQQLGCRFSHGDLVSAGHRPAYFDQRTRICRAGS